MDVDTIGYPAFWLAIRKDFDSKRINWDISCPMNVLFKERFKSYNPEESTIPTGDFIYNYEEKIASITKMSKKAEKMIVEYSWNQYLGFQRMRNEIELPGGYWEDQDSYLLLSSEFENMVRDLKDIMASNKYLPIASWLINKAMNCVEKSSKLRKNRVILLKTLYKINPEGILQIFSKRLKIKDFDM